MKYYFLDEYNESIYSKLKLWFVDEHKKKTGIESTVININKKKELFLKLAEDVNKKEQIFIFSNEIFPLLHSISIAKYMSNYLNQSFSNYFNDKPVIIYLTNDIDKKIIYDFMKKTTVRNFFNDLAFYARNNKKIVKNVNISNASEVLKKTYSNIQKNMCFYDFDNEDIFTNYVYEKYFVWKSLHLYKLKMASSYPKIIWYDGKNKHISKKIVMNLGIPVPETYFLLNKIQEIDMSKLPKNFVIKPTHLDNSRYVKIVINNKFIDGEKLTYESLVKYFDGVENKFMNKELMPLISKYYSPKIIIEEYIFNDNKNKKFPLELKFYVFCGKIKFIIAFDKNIQKHKFAFYNRYWEKIPASFYSFKKNIVELNIPKPKYFNRIKKDVEKIYNKFNSDLNNSFVGKFIRIDFFITNDSYKFGEFSLFPNGGKGYNLNDFAKRKFVEYWLNDVYDTINPCKENINYTNQLKNEIIDKSLDINLKNNKEYKGREGKDELEKIKKEYRKQKKKEELEKINFFHEYILNLNSTNMISNSYDNFNINMEISKEYFP